MLQDAAETGTGATDATETGTDPQPTKATELADSEMKVKEMELDATGKVLNINIKESENRAGAALHFKVADYSVFRSKEDKMFYLQKLDFQVNDISIFQSGMEQFLSTFFDVLGSVLRSVMMGCLIIVPPLGIDIIKLFQMLDYLLYFNIEPPTNLKAFLTLFSSTPLDYSPNPFLDLTDSVHGCTPPKKFEENDMTCYILNNNGGYLLQLVAFALLNLIAIIIVKQSYADLSERNIIRRAANSAIAIFNLQFLGGFLDSTQIDIYMSVYINFLKVNEKSAYLLMNFLLS